MQIKPVIEASKNKDKKHGIKVVGGGEARLQDELGVGPRFSRSYGFNMRVDPLICFYCLICCWVVLGTSVRTQSSIILINSANFFFLSVEKIG